MQGLSSPPLGKYFSYLEVCQIYISQIYEQFKVHIEGLQSNIPFIILEISFRYFYFLKVKVHMMEECFYIVMLNITSLRYSFLLFHINLIYYFFIIHINQFRFYSILQKHVLKKMLKKKVTKSNNYINRHN